MKKEETLENVKESKGFSGVESAVIKGMVQKCNVCKRFGASVKCKFSGKFYHWACACVSGAYMDKKRLILVGTDSLSKVATLGTYRFLVSFSPFNETHMDSYREAGLMKAIHIRFQSRKH